MRGLRARVRAIALHAEQEIWRDEDGLDPDREPFGERSLLLFGPLHEIDITVQLPGGDRAAEGAARETGHDAARAHRRVRAVDVTARVNLLQAGARGAGRLRVRAADIHCIHPHAVHRDLLELRLCIVELLAQLHEALGCCGWRRLELARGRRRTL